MWFGYWINCAPSSRLSHVYYWNAYSCEHHSKHWEQSPRPLQTCFDKNSSFWQNSFDTDANTNVLNATIEYILSTKRFDEPLFQWKQKISKQVYESVYSVFIAVVACTICKFLFYFIRICFIPGYPYNFRYLVIVSFNFTMYDILYIKQRNKQKNCHFFYSSFWKFWTVR